MAAHKFADLIHAWADGAQIQNRLNGSEWKDCPEPMWMEQFEYRIKPAEPEQMYPTCSMSQDEVIRAWTPPYGWKGLRDFGDKVLRHACDNGQIVTREEFDRAVGDREKRDEAVAIAALEYINTWMAKAPCYLMEKGSRVSTEPWHINAILKSVK